MTSFCAQKRYFLDVWAKLEELTGDGWPFAIFYRKIIKNHYPSTRKHSSRMHTIYCHGHWEGGLCLPRGYLPGDVCPGVSLFQEGGVCVCQGVSTQGVSAQGVSAQGVYVCVYPSWAKEGVPQYMLGYTAPPVDRTFYYFRLVWCHQLRQSEYIISYDSDLIHHFSSKIFKIIYLHIVNEPSIDFNKNYLAPNYSGLVLMLFRKTRDFFLNGSEMQWFKESDKSLKHEVGSIYRSSLLPVSCCCCGSILVSLHRRFE